MKISDFIDSERYIEFKRKTKEKEAYVFNEGEKKGYALVITPSFLFRLIKLNSVVIGIRDADRMSVYDMNFICYEKEISVVLANKRKNKVYYKKYDDFRTFKLTDYDKVLIYDNNEFYEIRFMDYVVDLDRFRNK